jgi:hypothetical protein
MNWGEALNVFIGSIPALAIVAGFFVRIDRRITIWLIEHEVLIDWWQREHPNQSLPTRKKH